MSSVTATAVVIDRATAARMPEGLDDMGGAWAESFQLWQRLSTMQYVVMLADTKERLRLRAPLVYMANDMDGLQIAIGAACERLSGHTCRWAIFMEEGTDAIALVREQLLIETRMEGRA